MSVWIKSVMMWEFDTRRRFKYHQIRATQSESEKNIIRSGDDEQRKEDKCDIDLIFSFYHCYLCGRTYLHVVTVTKESANSLKRIIE